LHVAKYPQLEHILTLSPCFMVDHSADQVSSPLATNANNAKFADNSNCSPTLILSVPKLHILLIALIFAMSRISKIERGIFIFIHSFCEPDIRGISTKVMIGPVRVNYLISRR
jgi:hypothetical protein